MVFPIRNAVILSTWPLLMSVRGGLTQKPHSTLMTTLSLEAGAAAASTHIPTLSSPVVSGMTANATSTESQSDLLASADSIPRVCPVRSFFRPIPKNWMENKTDFWLNDWWRANEGAFRSHNGMVSLLGEQYLSRPDLACAQASSPIDCSFDPCDIDAPPDLIDQQIRSPYYVLESIRRFHGFFISLSSTLQSGGIIAAMNGNSQAFIFYFDKEEKDLMPLKELINKMTLVLSLACLFIAPWVAAVALVLETMVSVGSTMLGAAQFSVLSSIPAHANDTPTKAADVGHWLARFFHSSMEHLLTASSTLMRGDKFGPTDDLRSFLSQGVWVDYPGMDEAKVLRLWTNLLTVAGINYLYRQQKVFIAGGGPCDDTGGIGEGPAEAKLCRDGRAWFLYYWKESLDPLTVGKGSWGYMSPPPGFDRLGPRGELTDITPQVIINSSLGAFLAAGGNNSYTADLAHRRLLSATQGDTNDPRTAGLGWEGIFNIPVCDLGAIVFQKDWLKKDELLQPYGKDNLLTWCGDVCSQSKEQTTEFLKLANMEDFDSINHYCP